MKKLLSMIGVISVVGTGASSVIACGDSTKQSTIAGSGATLEPTSQAVAAKIR